MVHENSVAEAELSYLVSFFCHCSSRFVSENEGGSGFQVPVHEV